MKRIVLLLLAGMLSTIADEEQKIEQKLDRESLEKLSFEELEQRAKAKYQRELEVKKRESKERSREYLIDFLLGKNDGKKANLSNHFQNSLELLKSRSSDFPNVRPAKVQKEKLEKLDEQALKNLSTAELEQRANAKLRREFENRKRAHLIKILESDNAKVGFINMKDAMKSYNSFLEKDRDENEKREKVGKKFDDGGKLDRAKRVLEVVKKEIIDTQKDHSGFQKRLQTVLDRVADDRIDDNSGLQKRLQAIIKRVADDQIGDKRHFKMEFIKDENLDREIEIREREWDLRERELDLREAQMEISERELDLRKRELDLQEKALEIRASEMKMKHHAMEKKSRKKE